MNVPVLLLPTHHRPCALIDARSRLVALFPRPPNPWVNNIHSDALTRVHSPSRLLHTLTPFPCSRQGTTWYEGLFCCLFAFYPSSSVYTVCTVTAHGLIYSATANWPLPFAFPIVCSGRSRHHLRSPIPPPHHPVC